MSMKVVTMGGGTGQSVILRALKGLDCEITAIVGMADSGGSSGILRDDLKMLPPGDIRHCLLALTPGNNAFCELLNYRFEEGALKGHNLGNIFLAGLYKVDGDFVSAIQKLSKLLDVSDKVLPVTLDCINLSCELQSGIIIKKEDEIDSFRGTGNDKIKSAWLEPAALLYESARLAIEDADYIIIGPGDLYTSIVQVLLAGGMKEALQKSHAKKIYFANLMKKFGQTNLLSLKEQIAEVENYSGVNLDYVIANNNFYFPEKVLERYRSVDCEVEYFEAKDFAGVDYKLICCDLLASKIYEPLPSDPLKNRSMIRHDFMKIRRILMDLLYGYNTTA